MLFFGLLADAVHLAIAGGNTQPEKFISLFCLWSFLLNTEITLPFTNCGKFLLVSLINECQTKVATYFTQTDCQGNNIVLLSSKIGGTFPPWNLKKAVAINFSGLFFSKLSLISHGCWESMVQFGFNVKRLVTILIVPVKKDKDVQLLSDILDLRVHRVFKLDP